MGMLLGGGSGRERTYEEKMRDGVSLILDNHIHAFADYLCKTTYADWKFLRTGEREKGLNICDLSIILKYDKAFSLRAELFSYEDPVLSVVIGDKSFSKRLHKSDFECSEYCKSENIIHKLEKLYWTLLAEKEGKTLHVRKHLYSEPKNRAKEKHEKELDEIREKVKKVLKVENTPVERVAYVDFVVVGKEDEEENPDE